MMKYADHHGFPIVTFVDTPGAFADLKSEELGQVSMQLFYLICKFPSIVHLFSEGPFLYFVNMLPQNKHFHFFFMQGEAIAQNLRTMFGLKVPIITVVTGEGGSGGALAIACSNKLFMLENSAFYVAR